jgi:translation initiation factor 1
LNIVYRSGVGRICPGCRRPIAQCACRDARGKAVQPGGGAVRVGRATQGRAGKAVSVITGLPLSEAELAALATELPKRCGSGWHGALGLIEIRATSRRALVAELLKRGYSAKRSG